MEDVAGTALTPIEQEGFMTKVTVTAVEGKPVSLIKCKVGRLLFQSDLDRLKSNFWKIE